jgi:hypothetical protein
MGTILSRCRSDVGGQTEKLHNEDHSDIEWRISERPEYVAGIDDIGSAYRMWEGICVTTDMEYRVYTTIWIKVVRIEISVVGLYFGVMNF